MAFETVEQALDGLRDPQTFAELASVLLLDEYPELVMGARTGDLGRDGRVQLGIWGDEVVVIQYSLDKKWQPKIDRELRRYKKDASLPKRMIYVTHLTATAAAQKTRIEKAVGLGVELRIFERGWLWPRLQHKHRRLAEELLGLRPALPGRFVDAEERRAQLEKSIPGFNAPAIETQGRAAARSAVEAALADAEPAPAAREGPRPPRIILLDGPGGMGKTRAALDAATGVQALVLQAAQRFDRDAAGALAPYDTGVLIVDDAHRVDDLSGVRVLLDDPAWKGWQVVMTLRPGYAHEVLDHAGVDANEARTIPFEGLGRPQAAKLIADPPYSITLNELARHLVELAQGNPLMLHLGAEAAKRGDLTPRGQADLVRAYAQRMRRSLPEGLHGDLVTMAALYGRVAITEHLDVVRHLHPAAALPDLRSALADAADAGLGVFDGDAFSVAPEAIAPVVVLDELLRGGGARLSIDDFPLGSLDSDRVARERVLGTLTAAVHYGSGEGRERLRSFSARGRGRRDDSPEGWLGAIREARVYARALPQDAAELLDQVLRLPSDDLRGSPVVIDAAAETASELAQISLPAGLPALLSVVALDTRDRGTALSSPRKTLATLLQRSPSYGGRALTDRTVEALRATRAWLEADRASVARQRIALRVSLMLVAVAYEFMGPSAADAMSIQLGAVPAPDTREHRAAIRDAATFAAELIATAEPDALVEIRGGYPALLQRAAGLSPSPMGELPGRLRTMMRAPVTVIRTAVVDAWDRLPIGVRLRVMQSDDNRRVAARAAADPQVDRFSVMFGVIRAGRRRRDEWGALMQRATDLGRELGPEQALDLLEQALGHAEGRLRVIGGRNLMRGAGAKATPTDASAAIRRMSQDGELRPYLGSLLSGSLLGPGLLAETVRDVAADPNTADQVVDVLDLTDPAEELRLTELLLGNASAHVALADHLRACDRRSAGERAEALVRLAETTSDLLLPQVLEQFGLLESSVRVPPALRARFAKQIARAAGESALDRGEAGNLSDAFSLLVSHGDDAWLDVIDERRVAMLAPQGSGDRRMWDLVPEDFGPGISELTDRQRDEALPRIAQWHEETEHDAYGWRVELGLADLLPRVGANRPGLVAVLARWYALGGHARARTLHMVSTLYARGALEPVLEELLAVSTTADDEELIAALSVPPMSWVGDLEEEYSGRATFFARPRRGNSRARSFAAKAETHFGGLAEAERLRTRKRHEGYDD